MDLHLLRAMVIQIGQGEEAIGLEAQLGDVALFSTQAIRIDEKLVGSVFIASVPVSIVLGPEEPITIPVEARREAESALETTARLLAIDRQVTNSLSSPMPFVGLTSDDPAVLAQLDGKVSSQRVMAGRQGAKISLGLFSDIDPKLLFDRVDGVALLAEALNSATSLGRYMQLMRLFERSFKLGPGGVTNPLIELLRPSPFGIDDAEVRSWTDARAPSAHADRRDEFYLDADVRPIVDRMLQAGYEVLLNKKSWRSPSSERRDAWRPNAGSRGTGSDIFVTKGKGATLTFELLDGFEAYPLVLAGPFDALLPRAAWLEGDATGGRLRVMGSWVAAK